jgi:hypothetical protein
LATFELQGAATVGKLRVVGDMEVRTTIATIGRAVGFHGIALDWVCDVGRNIGMSRLSPNRTGVGRRFAVSPAPTFAVFRVWGQQPKIAGERLSCADDDSIADNLNYGARHS